MPFREIITSITFKISIQLYSTFGCAYRNLHAYNINTHTAPKTMRKKRIVLEKQSYIDQ